MNIWTLEHEKQEHIMFYTIEKWGRRYSKVKKLSLVDRKCEDNILHPSSGITSIC